MPIVHPKKSLAGRTPTPRSGIPAWKLLSQKIFPGRGPKDLKLWRRRLLLGGAVVALLGIIVVVGVVAWVSQDLPDPNKINTRVVAQSTKIYARDGATLLYEIHGDQRRTLVDLNQVGKYTKNAVLSIEDKDFYKHQGVSLRAIARAIFVDLTRGSKSQGGSTITQQLVKNAILTNEKSYIRKVKEIILSYQIERRFTKDQILKLYFNEIPWGANAYGAEAAAQTYFGKSAKDLDLAESALLAAMVQRPSYYSPRGSHTEELVSRQRFVFDRMVAGGDITTAQADEAKKVDILKRISPTRDRVVAPHFVFYVRDQLVQKYGELTVERGGLKVITTLDPKLQTIAEEEVKRGVESNETKYHATNAALVATDPKTGQVLAMVGSRDYFDTEHDGNYNVATAVLNPGSSFKPVVYLTAFTKGYTPDTIVFDLKTNFGPDGSGKNFSPNNYDLKVHGPLKMRQTLAGSLNIPAVKTLYLTGLPATLDTADKLGYTTIDRGKVGLALAIGGGGVRLLEHVAAFSVFANDGVRNPTATILRIEDKNGKVLEQYKQDEKRVVDQEPVRNLVSILSDNNARAFVFGSRSPLVIGNRPIAAKTGTTNDFRDAWTVGFTPSLAAGVWRGNNDNSSMKGGADGVVVAAPIWNAFMKRALEGAKVEQFKKPKPNTAKKPILRGQLQGDTPISVDSETGRQIPDSCLATWPKEFIKQVTLKEVHTILYYVDKDDPDGPAPADPTKDPMFAEWEKPIAAWAKKNNYVAKTPKMEDCSLRSTGGTTPITVTSPAANETITSTSLPVTVTAGSEVTQVAYAVDGVALATVSTAPFSTTLDLSAIANGFHTLTATATTMSGTTGTMSITINLLTKDAGATAYFITPAPNSTVASDSFPRTVKVFIYDPVGVSSVTLSMKNPDGSVVVQDTVESPGEPSITFSWPTTPPGAYQLFFVVKNKKGVSTQSDNLKVTVS